jgi:hypothetical protein
MWVSCFQDEDKDNAAYVEFMEWFVRLLSVSWIWATTCSINYYN